jgi:hypothetical protein
MASSGEDSYTGSSSDDELLAQDDIQDTEKEDSKVEERQSARKRSRSQSPSRAVLPANPRAIALMQKKSPRGSMAMILMSISPYA